ncbi:DUF190 domain-containing protein [Marinilongibacter aquaticus]|uniref:DUF190 domain-containing protein n=1 Tax=Marinilongibacter aquaticus TaxID=2975157 RepID=UPI0021BD6F3C|nr:DUF190 domain-containing protein [Marinilongibacter aquaticus]UBM58641.1 DUF190 domain-containing protein [Marinilongibacter aquaticus]
MENKIRTTTLGKLRIFLKSGETVKGNRFIRRMFPQSKYRNLLNEAKNAGIRNAHIYYTHAAYERGGAVQHHHDEHGNEGLTVCLELVDEKDILKAFFSQHKDMLKDKTVIYKEVEMWEYAD